MRIITGSARGTQLKTPEGMNTRPTTDRVKEAMFSIIQSSLPGAHVLDLFGGTGQLGLESVSRGAEEAVFVDCSPTACRLISENIARTHMTEKCRVIQSDYLSYLNRCSRSFTVVFLDPPYAETYLETALKRITEIDILQSGGIIVCERPVGKQLPDTYPGFRRSRDYKYGKTLLTVYTRL